MNKIPKIHIDDFIAEEGGWSIGGKHWDSTTLYTAAKDLPTFDLPLIGIATDFLPWVLNNFSDVIYHLKRIENVKLEHPIILDTNGIVIDGWHRIAKAVLKGDTTIKATRLKQMPLADRVDKE